MNTANNLYINVVLKIMIIKSYVYTFYLLLALIFFHVHQPIAFQCLFQPGMLLSFPGAMLLFPFQHHFLTLLFFLGISVIPFVLQWFGFPSQSLDVLFLHLFLLTY